MEFKQRSLIWPGDVQSVATKVHEIVKISNGRGHDTRLRKPLPKYAIDDHILVERGSGLQNEERSATEKARTTRVLAIYKNTTTVCVIA